MAYDEAELAPLPEEDSPDYFDILVGNCIAAFRIAYSDSVALDANGVIGKQRYLVMDNPRYQRETKRLRAQKTLSDLRVIQDLAQEIDSAGAGTQEDEEDDTPEVEVLPPEPTGPPIVVKPPKKIEDPVSAFDIRHPEQYEKKVKEKEKAIEKEKEKQQEIARKEEARKKAAMVVELPKTAKPGRPRKVFDKSLIEMKLKLFQQQRSILSEEKSEEEREGDALNIFFISVTAEEFEALENTEVSVGTSDSNDGFKEDEESKIKKLLGDNAKTGDLVDGGTAFYYEEVDGEMVMVENR